MVWRIMEISPRANRPRPITLSSISTIVQIILSLIKSMLIIIRCILSSLFIGREPATWPANNWLQIMVCSCPMSSNFIGLQIILCWCVRETTLFSILRSLSHENGSLPKIFIKKQTRWPNDKTIIELSYRKISWLVSVSQINYSPQPSASALSNHDILLNLVQ